MCEYVAEEDDVEVQFKVGFTYEYSVSKPNYAEAYKWYSKAASNSHTEAVYSLGSLYERGAGVYQDHQRATQLYKQVRTQKGGHALYRLAVAFHYGKGVEVNWNEAIRYYTLAAELGYSEYQCELGRQYENGGLVEKNLLEAIKWYTKAYLQGYNSISSKLYNMYQDKPYERFFYEKLFRILSVAEHGYFRLNKSYNIGDFGSINNRMGNLYVFGYGVKKDLNIA
jgi:TPR repeat protein